MPSNIPKGKNDSVAFSKKHFVVWGINYFPEMTGIAPFNVSLCEYLSACGHEVSMVASFAYYPEWRKRDEDRKCLYRTDLVNGIRVNRCWSYVPQSVSALRRILHETSFILTSMLRVLSLKSPDAYVVVSPPLLLGVAAWLVSLLKGRPFVFHIQDLQPDAALGLGMLRRGHFIRLLFWVERFIYEKATKVSGISGGILAKLREKGVSSDKLVLFPNGIHLPLVLPHRGSFRSRHGIAPDTFLAIYSGNLGAKQGLDILTEAGRIVERRQRNGSGDLGVGRVLIIIAGDGAFRANVTEQINAARLQNVLLLPLQQEAAYREMLADADCMVITQRSGTGSFFFPSKLLYALAAGKALLTVADEDSGLAAAVAQGKFGINVRPGCPELFAEALLSLAARRTRPNDAFDSLDAMGRMGLEFVEQFESEQILQVFERQIRDLG